MFHAWRLESISVAFCLAFSLVALGSVSANAQSPAVSFSPASLNFGNQVIGTTSAPLTVTMTNTGTAKLTLNTLYITGTNSQEFAPQSNTCTAGLAPGASCTITDQFHPSQTGAASAFLSIFDNASNSPQTVNLTGTGITSTLGFSATSLSFGNQNVGTTSAAQTITLSNTGTVAITMTSIAITGTNSGDFVQTNTCGSSLAAGANCTINVTFTPTASGSRAASVTLTDNAAGSPQSVTLSGTGTVPGLNFSVTSLSFGTENVGTTTTAQAVTLANTGSTAVSITSIATTGTNSGDFAQTNTCGTSLAAGANCTINVTFTPTASGSRTASVTITDTAAGSPQTISLTGTGATLTVSFSPASLNFGNQVIGTTSAPLTVTMTNTGTAKLTLNTLYITGTNSQEFAPQSNTCTAGLAPGASCTITDQFHPSQTGAASAFLSIFDNASNSPQTVNLTGTGITSTLGFSATSLSFGNQNVGTTSAAQTITLSNTGTVAITMTSIAITGTNSGDFVQTNTCGSSLAAGANCTINVTFTPTASGSRTASVTITDSVAGSPQTISLTGTGAMLTVTFSPTSLNFGNQVIGTTSAPLTVTMTNTGTAKLTLNTLYITGTNSQEFAPQSNTCTAGLAPGASCTITDQFHPSQTGAASAFLSIFDNASNSPQTVNLTGTGIPLTLEFSATSLSFGNQNVGTTSAAQTITLSNTGTVAITMTSIAITGTNSGDFAQTNTCGSSLAAGAHCAINVTFTPTANGNWAASVTITDSVAGSPQTISLTGTGAMLTVTFSPTSLNFGTQDVGTTTTAQTVTLTNTGNAAVTIIKVEITGTNSYDFNQTNTCGTSLAAGANCTISLTFHPSAPVERFGTLSIFDNASGSPQKVTLTGTGTAVSGVSLSLSSINFSNQNVYTASAAKTVTLNNIGSTALGIVNINATGDFAQSNNCPSSLVQGSNCNINVTFKPSATGARTGYVTISDTDPTLLQTVNLSGTGQNPSTTVTVSPVVASLTFSQTAQFQASINGSASSNVAWAVNGIAGGNSTVGTISSAGLYTAPSSAGSYLIQATSIADSTQFADALMVVTNYAGVSTYHNDNARTGQNLNETVLTTGNVNTTQFGKLFTYPVDDKIYAQPLYVPNVNIQNQGTHNVVYAVTENDSVYAFDADGLQSSPLWQVSFLRSGVTPVDEATDIGCTNLFGHVGITGTPVFNSATNAIYLVATTKEIAGSTTTFVQRLHALNVTTGAELSGSPVVIQASVDGSGDGSATVTFNPLMENQRAGLLLLNGVIYIAWSSHCDILPYHGWMMAYNAASLLQVAVYNTTPNANKGGIWQGGSAPAVDESNKMYVETGDGLFDANTGGPDVGDAFLEMSTTSWPALEDYFAPSDQTSLDDLNEDLGSCGPMVLPDQPGSTPHLVVGCDKLGRIFVLNRDNMGGYSSAGDNIFQEITGSLAPATRSVAAYWQNYVYFVSVGDFIKQFRLYNGMLSTTPVAQGLASFSYPGVTPTISANGSSNGIVWVLDSSKFASGGPAVLNAYDAANTANLLYSSAQNSSRDNAGGGVKFTVPTVANGKVYVPTASELDVYGLLP